MKIDSKSIPLAYTLAKQVYAGSIKQSQAAKTLSVDVVVSYFEWGALKFPPSKQAKWFCVSDYKRTAYKCK